MNRYCSNCGAGISAAALDGTTRCVACGELALAGPKVLVSCFVFQGDRLLWMRRAHDPQRGFWAVPAGFMELGETLRDGALRETIEEAGAQVEMQELYTMLNVVRVGQVHFFYRAQLLDTRFDPGPETIEARLFREDEIPWEQIAFRTVKETLRRWFDDRRQGQFGFHTVDIG